MGRLLYPLLFVASSCTHPEYPVTDHCDGRRFYNEDREADVSKGWLKVMKWQFSGQREEWPDMTYDNAQPRLPAALGEAEAAVTFINHATELIQLRGLNVLSDPVYSERVSPLSWFGPKRHRQPGIALAALPRIDVVIVSHNHYDHLDLPSLVALEGKDHPKFIVPLGNKALLQGEGIKDVEELDWWQSLQLPGGQKITAVPMQHWSTRGVADRFTALWSGFVIESPRLKVLFAGDTGYNRQFNEIYARFGAVDLSILPIGAYAPRWFMHEQHMDPREAVVAHQDLHSRFSIGTHFGTFQLTDEAAEDPVSELKASLKAAEVAAAAFVAPKNGETVYVQAAPPREK